MNLVNKKFNGIKPEPGLVVQKILDLNNYFILGIGNIVDWGEQFINRLKEHV